MTEDSKKPERKRRIPDKKLNREMVEAYQPEAKEYNVPDPGCHGLYLRVWPNGKKSWAFRYSICGRPTRVALGMYPSVTLDQARAKAAKLHGRVLDLEDPAAAIKKEKSEWKTVDELWEAFDAEHIAKKRPATQRGYRHYGTKYILPAVGRIRVKDVDLVQVKAIQRSATKVSDRTSNYVIAVLSKLLSFAEEEGLIDPGTNPCQAVTRKAEQHRQRFLEPHEIQKVWLSMDTLEGPGAEVVIAAKSRGTVHYRLNHIHAAAIKLLLLTGMRVSEVLHLKWEEISVRDAEGNAVAVLLEHKTMSRGAKKVILTPAALEVVMSIRPHGLSPYVFAGSGKDGTIGGSINQAWRAVRYLAGLEDVRIHDLRHTYASIGIANGLTLEQVGQLLGHSSTATTKRYSHLVEEAAMANANKIQGVLNKRRA